MVTIDQYEALTKYTKTAPVDLKGLADAMGISVREEDLPRDFTGKIQKGGDYYIITLNKNDTHNRKRFTLAHELAHFCLHKDDIDKVGGIIDAFPYKSNLLNSEKETKANVFAVKLITPTKIINELLNQGHKSLEFFAKHFDVNPSAMISRFKMVDFTEWTE